MASKRRNKRLSIPKNWRIVKKTRNNGEVFYLAQYRNGIWGWESSQHTQCHNGHIFNDGDKVKSHITSQIAKHAAKYNEQCGDKVAKKEIINFE